MPFTVFRPAPARRIVFVADRLAGTRGGSQPVLLVVGERERAIRDQVAICVVRQRGACDGAVLIELVRRIARARRDRRLAHQRRGGPVPRRVGDGHPDRRDLVDAIAAVGPRLPPGMVWLSASSALSGKYAGSLTAPLPKVTRSRRESWS